MSSCHLCHQQLIIEKIPVFPSAIPRALQRLPQPQIVSCWLMSRRNNPVADLTLQIEIDELSIGDFVLSGGETASYVFLDAILRLIPGVIGNEQSKNEESFENGLLEYPQYTKPQIWEEKSVPNVLLSGDHAKIKDWRLTQSKAITRDRRPDLWQKYNKKN